MRIAINQPYLFAYKGYFDLIASVDKFVVADNYKWIKGGWINRNFFPKLFTFRVEKHPDHALISECYYKDLKADYKRFPIHTKLTDRIFSLMQPTYSVAYNNTIAIKEICKELGIKTEFFLASTINHGTKWQGVLDIVWALGGDTYVNPCGGHKLYDQKDFGGVKLEFMPDESPRHSILLDI